MSFFRNIYIYIRTYTLTKRNGNKSVKIRDSARAFLQINKGSVNGDGVLYLNPNAINPRESLKLRIDDSAELRINGAVKLFTNTNVHVGKNAILEIGQGTYINEGTKISVKTECTIGKNCAISNDVTILDSDFHQIEGYSQSDTGVHIGNHVWICANATILKNVSIGDNCIIGANSVVLHDVPDCCLIVGNPAKIIRRDINWK